MRDNGQHMFVAILQDLADLGGGLGFENELGVTAVFAHPVTVEGFEVRASFGADSIDDGSRRAEDVFEVADMVLVYLVIGGDSAGRLESVAC